MHSFSDFPLLPSLQDSLKEMGLTTPTDIQWQAIPRLLNGASLVGLAETGSGKTLAFALPVLNVLKSLENEGDRVSTSAQPRALVVVPTRELGEQVSRVFKPFTHTTRLRVRTVLGGSTLDVAKRNVAGQFEVLVATPGRLVKLMDRGLIRLNDVRILVFDEADQMLDRGFLPDANRIVRGCPESRQLALFSATISTAVEHLIREIMPHAEMIRSEGSHRVVATLKTVNRDVIDGKRFPLLEEVLRHKIAGGTLIFTNTRDQCDKLALELRAKNRDCVVYRGEMDKVERRANLKRFREGQVELLISTDLAARGLDVHHVGRVINYHLPQQMANYLHRVGRTARAGRAGEVINFVTERDRAFVKQLHDFRAQPKGAGKQQLRELPRAAAPKKKAPRPQK